MPSALLITSPLSRWALLIPRQTRQGAPFTVNLQLEIAIHLTPMMTEQLIRLPKVVEYHRDQITRRLEVARTIPIQHLPHLRIQPTRTPSIIVRRISLLRRNAPGVTMAA